MITCKGCSMKNLEWVQIEGRWKLYDANGQMHNCTGMYSKATAPKIDACRHGILRSNWCDQCEEDRNKI